MAKAIPTHSRVVIIGGGIVGASIAYHLAKLGWSDILLIERKRLTSGTTWHAAGLVGQLRATANLTRLAQYTTNLYATLEAETGQATGFVRRGSLSIATSQARLEELLRGASMARTFGLDVHRVGPAEIKRYWPLLNVDDVVGGVHLPGDGQTNPIDTTMALIKGATMRGVKVIEGVEVTAILTRNGRATGVSTSEGELQADHVVIASGMWSRRLGLTAGVDIPLQACEHFYIVTEPFPELTPDLPVLRDPDNCAYYKEDAGKLLLGAFEPNAKPWAVDGIPPGFEFGELPDDVEHFAPVLEAAMRRLPALERVGIRKFFNGPESFTPDVRYLLGETPELRNLFVATGFNSIGIQSAGGAGKALAEWIVEGHAPMDLADVDIRRMQPFQVNRRYLKERVSESLGLLYAMHWPHRQYETARGVRTSPLHERLGARGACFGEAAGWERANWFAPEGVEPRYEYSYGRQNWFAHSAAEHLAVRQAVGLFDMTSFGKFRVEGRDAEAVLQRICANDVAVAPGRIVYTQWLNERAGIEADLTVTRLSETVYQIVTAGAAARRDLAWLKRHIPSDAHAIATDITSAEAVLCVMGPNSRALLQAVSGADLSDAVHPFATAREIEIGYARLRAARVTYVGELGWELYVPTEFARGVFDALAEAGPAFGLRLAGLHALDSCRIEKAYRHWGHDIGDEDTPLQAGLMFAVKLDKGDFIGREALLRQREAGPRRRLVQFLLADPEPLLYHDEPIWHGGRMVGRTTSGAYGHHLGGAVALGYVREDEAPVLERVVAGGFEIEIAGRRLTAQASLTPLYDPKNIRVRA
ncbi:4-methylaminobutanoate oxidase (formaldehyde-forming) [Rhizobiales bacterium GAS188]|nr:4-methylaminobutanoate oxidase (formaldehyde-forming) [Rhizobiales bacterium GAS188]SEF02415.1 4-methylaminobutanoate oxidase (formaldehyde-forming) [Rhizobiales bacterium GAS188]